MSKQVQPPPTRAEEKMKQTVVLYPGGGVSHVSAMTELANVFLGHGYDVTMVMLEPPFKSSSDSGSTAIQRIAASNPSISFHVLPALPDPDLAAATGRHPFLLLLQLFLDYNELLEAFLRSSFPQPQGQRQRLLHSVVLDTLCVHAVDVCVKLDIPVYTFCPSGASCLTVLTQFPALVASRQTGLKEIGDTTVEFLGVPPMPASHLMKELLEHPEEELCKEMTNIWKRNTETMGILVNTFESLERRAVQSLRDPLCVPGRILPPIYCVGPLVANHGGRRNDACQTRAWLDSQPDQSVVFICFGSTGTVSEEQLKEIAVGLDRSGQRFLWSVRTPPPAESHDAEKYFEVRPEPADLHALMPQGFLERTKGRGLVVKSWVPQVDVLRHRATGAFVTHCGWNSVLEAVSAGVPMLCWPLEAEQKMNKVFMTEDMGVAMELDGYRTGFVKAGEVEAKVRLVIEGEDGRQLRARVAARKQEAEVALKEEGASRAAFLQFLLDVDTTSNIKVLTSRI